ncbi:hypothetical protein [Ruegeria atlantica]|uniref:hypothetical protein n=1 Tax=Ruegeria atlantica TaxID=81569 RepID=UPI001480E704|nr:hypothetical protein [Ruegeria atlantica]
MTNPNSLPSTHEVQSAIHRVRGACVVLTEDRARLSAESVNAFVYAVSCNTSLFC